MHTTELDAAGSQVVGPVRTHQVQDLAPRGYNLANMDTAAELIIEVLEDEECGYRARALGQGIFTHGATLDELRANIRDAVDAYYDGEPPLVCILTPAS